MDTYLELLEVLNTKGKPVSPRNKNVKEMLDVKFYIEDNRTLICQPGIRDVTDGTTNEGQYLRAEFVWYMAGSMQPNFISKYGSMWAKLINKFNEEDPFNGKINSNYGFQVFYKPATLLFDDKKATESISLFNWCLNELTKDPSSRKAIMQYTWPIIYQDGVNDFTCTQTQQFFNREDILYNLINIRSSDAIKGLTFDIPWWDFVGQAAAQYLNIEYGKMSVNIASSHFYETDSKLVNNMLENENKFTRKKMLINTALHVQRDGPRVSQDIANYYKSAIDKVENDKKDELLISNAIKNIDNMSKINDFTNVSFIDIIKYISNIHVFSAIALNDYVEKESLTRLNNEIFNLAVRIED